MQKFYYNLSGGINTNKTKIGLGQDTKRLFWADSKNIEIFKNQGIARQMGNKLLIKEEGKILALHEYPKNSANIVFALLKEDCCEIYYYDSKTYQKTLIKTYPAGISRISFCEFLSGLLIAPDNQGAVYYNVNSHNALQDLNLKDADGNIISSDVICIFAGRVFCAKGSTVYFSALGTFDNWEEENDAGYISKFHSSTSEIIAMVNYQGNLAIYKSDSVFLLSGSDPSNFMITKFANKGALSPKSVVTVDNRQFFVTENGVFCLEQAGILSQIMMSGEISQNIKEFFAQINYAKNLETFVLPYESKNQIWFFLAFKNNEFLNQIWIYDFVCDAWFKRVIPYQITSGATVSGQIYTGSNEGEIFVENVGNNFASKPIEFSFSSPFFNFGAPSKRKIIEDFNLIFDETVDNRFKFSVSKDYLQSAKDEVEFVNLLDPNCLMWADDNTSDDFNSVWANDDEFSFTWATSSEEAYKTDIFDANLAIQLHFEGQNLGDDLRILGFEFGEIMIDI